MGGHSGSEHHYSYITVTALLLFLGDLFFNRTEEIQFSDSSANSPDWSLAFWI